MCFELSKKHPRPGFQKDGLKPVAALREGLLSRTREWYQVIGRPAKFAKVFETLRDLVAFAFGRANFWSPKQT